MNLPQLSVAGHLFQAAMWRHYAMEWDRGDRRWVSQVLRRSRRECLDRCRANIDAAKELNRNRGDAQ